MNDTHLGRRSFLRGAGLVAAGALAPGLLTACGGGGSGGAGSGKGTIDLWMDIQGDANQKFYNENVIGAFEKDTPDVTVKTTYYKGQDLRRLIQTALQAKSGPDVVRGPSATQTLDWSKAGILADLSGYSKKYGWSDDISDWAYQAFTNDGKLFALPLRVDTMLWYFNKTLFEDKGWSTPKNRDDVEAFATEAMGQGIMPFGLSNVDWKAASEWLMSVFWNQYSGPDAVYQALTGEIQFTDPVFVDAVQLVKDWFDKGWIAGGVDKYFSVPSQELNASFGKGEIATIPQGVWFMSQVGQYFGDAAKNDNEWDWMPYATLRDEVPYPSFPLGIGGSLGINAASDNQDAAAEFLDWYYGDQKAALDRMAQVPATYNIPIQFSDGDIPSDIDPRAKRVLTSVNEAISSGNYGYVTWTWWPPKSDVFVYEGLDAVLTGKSSPKDYCSQLAQKFTEERNAGTIPQIMKRGSA